MLAHHLARARIRTRRRACGGARARGSGRDRLARGRRTCLGIGRVCRCGASFSCRTRARGRRPRSPLLAGARPVVGSRRRRGGTTTQRGAFLAEGEQSRRRPRRAELAVSLETRLGKRGHGAHRAGARPPGGRTVALRGAVLAIAGRLYVSRRSRPGRPSARRKRQRRSQLALLDDIRAGALNSVALAKSMLGLTDGVSAMEDALAFALGVNPIEAARGYINLASTLVPPRAPMSAAHATCIGPGSSSTERFGLGWQDMAPRRARPRRVPARRLAGGARPRRAGDRRRPACPALHGGGGALGSRDDSGGLGDAEGARADTARSLDMARRPASRRRSSRRWPALPTS